MNTKVQIDEKHMFLHENVMEVIDKCTTKKAHERRSYKAEENLDNKWYASYNQGKYPFTKGNNIKSSVYILKDTLRTFEDFKNKQQKCMK